MRTAILVTWMFLALQLAPVWALGVGEKAPTFELPRIPQGGTWSPAEALGQRGLVLWFHDLDLAHLRHLSVVQEAAAETDLQIVVVPVVPLDAATAQRVQAQLPSMGSGELWNSEPT